MDIITPIGELKTHCYNILDQAQKSNNRIIITRRGKVIAKITPVQPDAKESILGNMVGRAKITGDIIDPIEAKWEVEND